VGAALTDTGRVRQKNEDTVFFYQPADPVELAKYGTLALVADGMGGANGGRTASEMTSREVTQAYLASKGEPTPALRRALEIANRRVYRRSQKDEELTGMGSTCVVLVLKPPFAWAAWAGDSRLYLIRDGQIFQMTEDHSVVNEMVRQGLLTREEAFNHEDRNVVTRALGTHPKVEVDVWPEPYPVRAGDRFLLCSDGLHDLIGGPEILEMAGTGSVDAAAARLIDRANSRGGSDNISAILVDVAESEGTAGRDIRPTRDFVPENMKVPQGLGNSEKTYE